MRYNVKYQILRDILLYRVYGRMNKGAY